VIREQKNNMELKVYNHMTNYMVNDEQGGLGAASQASCYIEHLFELKCRAIRQGANILNEWRIRKESYCSYTATTIFDFQHYSRHDASHSVNILNYIEMLLGRERVDMLSVADLWALLECAYFHDIGMTFTHDQLVEMWDNDENFKGYLYDIACSDDLDLKHAYDYYKRIDDLLKRLPRKDNTVGGVEGEFMDSWPVELQKYVRLITTEYIRKHHSARSKAKMKEINERFGESALIGFIPERLYQIVAEASYLHNENFEEIFNRLSYSEIGFDTERLHPQFVAAMLRLGDLLDMDNNRFDQRALEHFGVLPYLSSLHYRKHRSLAHFEITTRKIEAKAVSEDEDVCAVTSGWFCMLENEVEHLICDWNRLVPEELQGCLLQRCDVKTYYGETLYKTELAKNYKIEKKRLLRLVAGFNLYDSPMDCLREYIQNALDASKMRIWMELQNDRIPYSSKVEDLTLICPYDIKKSVFEEYYIEIGSWVDMEHQVVFIRIEDNGIGMENECVDGLSVVGKSWRQRSVFKGQIFSMPDWLRPTGGFGIGLQSAFMLTDEVVIYTKSENESTGYEIHLFSPQKKGNVTKRRIKRGKNGTSILFRIKLVDIFKYIREADTLDVAKKMGKQIQQDESSALHDNLSLRLNLKFDTDIFSETTIKEMVDDFLEYYIKKNVPNILVPIRVCRDTRKESVQQRKQIISTYRSPYASQDGGFGYSDNVTINPLGDWTEGIIDGRSCIYQISSDMTMRIWDKDDNSSICIMGWPSLLKNLKQEEIELLNPVCYKNVRVRNGISPEMKLLLEDFLAVCIDVMGRSTEEVLDVQRSSFMQGFHIEKLMNSYLRFYIKQIFRCLTEKKVSKETNYISMLDFVLLAIRMLGTEEALAIPELWKKKEYVPKDINMKQITNGNICNVSASTEQVLSNLIMLLSPEESQKKEDNYTFFAMPMTEGTEEDTYSLVLPELKDGDELQKIQESLVKDGTYLYVLPPICNMLRKMSNRLDMHILRITEDPENRIYCAVKNIRKLTAHEPQQVITEEKLLYEVFQFDERERYVGKNISCKPYDSLKVKYMPGDLQEAGENNEYLISPISRALFQQVLEAAEVNPAESKINNLNNVSGTQIDKTNRKDSVENVSKYGVNRWFTKKSFLEIVHKSLEYEFIINWVYQNRCAENDTDITKERIQAVYDEMLEAMYQYIFFRKE
jgi:hypothetical protein